LRRQVRYGAFAEEGQRNAGMSKIALEKAKGVA